MRGNVFGLQKRCVAQDNCTFGLQKVQLDFFIGRHENVLRANSLSSLQKAVKECKGLPGDALISIGCK